MMVRYLFLYEEHYAYVLLVSLTIGCPWGIVIEILICNDAIRN